MPTVADIETKIAEYGEKLKTLNAPEHKRVKKRVLQSLGKLKKQLASLNGSAGHEGTNHSSKEEAKAPVEVAPAAPLQPMSRKQKKAKLNLLNRELAEYAQKKQLKMARKRFEWGIRKGITDIHTYANLLNAHVRCGDLEGAVQVFRRLSEAKLSPNIVIYTTLLKGYCESGDIKGALRLLFQDMIAKANIDPTARTINTFLRGCVRVGAVKAANEVVSRLVVKTDDNSSVRRKGHENDAADSSDSDSDSDSSSISDDGAVDDREDGTVSKIKSSKLNVARESEDENDEEDDEGAGGEGDASTYEYAVNLLCQSLRVREAALLAARAISSNRGSSGDSALPDVIDSAALYLSLAKAAALLGAWGEADKWMSLTTGALERSKSSQLRNTMLQKFNLSSTSTNAASGGGTAAAEHSQSQSQSQSQSAEDLKRGRSADLFAKHRRSEIEHELESLKGFVDAGRAYITSSSKSSQ